ncbi:MAG TPA: HIT family protein [Bacteroidales bacterium]|nr:HIT family protein [Bacteroidales bacterium]
MTKVAEICSFCDIGIKDAAFMESESYLAVYNIAPIVPGHSLVIPRNHQPALMSLSEEEAREFLAFAIKATKLICRAYSTDAFDWALQEGTYAGQTVEHLHLHIIPRKKGDLPHPGDWFLHLEKTKCIESSKRLKITTSEMAQTVSFLKNHQQSI